MALNLSTYAENKINEHIVGKTAWTMPTISIGLVTTASSDSATGTEVSGGSYARVTTSAATWTTSNNGVISNASTITFPTATANWGTVQGLILNDASSGGNCLVYGNFETARTVLNGDTFTIPAGALSFTLD